MNGPVKNRSLVGSGFPPSLRFASARRAVAQSAEAAAGLEKIRLKADATGNGEGLRYVRPPVLFEQIVEGFLRAARRRRGRGRRAGCRRAGLALDGGAGREQRAAVALVFRRHPRRDAVVERTFPADAGVERHALDAGMHVDATAG